MVKEAGTVVNAEPALVAPAAERPVFIVGCGRSGTTWLQMLIAQHPAVATAPETHVFSRYLGLLERRWQQESKYRQVHGTRSGIQGPIDRSGFDALLRRFAIRVLQGVCKEQPDVALVVEKSPNHVQWLPLIHRCFPEARFVHVVRDPRAVVASHRAAAKGWARHWAASGIVQVATQWYEAVRAVRSSGIPADIIREIRYEDLLESPVDELSSVLEWLGLEVERETVVGYVDACRFDRLQRGSDDATARVKQIVPVQARTFFRRGTAGGWTEDLTPAQVALIERVAGEWMAEFGYAPSAPAVLGYLYAWRPALKRLIRGLRWRLDAALKRMDDRL